MSSQHPKKSVTIKPSKGLRGEMTVPGDKSISHRALIFSSLAKGESSIKGLLLGEDVLNTMTILQAMGVKMSHTAQTIKDGDTLIVEGRGRYSLQQPKGILDCGNSGTTMRLMMGLVSALGFEATFTGDESLNRRPMERVMKPMTDRGARFETKTDEQGRRLITVFGSKNLRGGRFDLAVASAQVKSAHLLAGLFCQEQTIVSEPKASRDHTEKMLSSQGAPLTILGNTITLDVLDKESDLNSLNNFEVPGDFSSAAFFIVAGLIVPNSQILIKNVCLNPTRAALLIPLQKMGGNIQIKNKRIVSGEEVGDILVKSSRLKATRVEGDIIPSLIDEIPIFASCAMVADGQSVVKDAKELRVKESDRIKTIHQELAKLGAHFTEFDDGFELNGQKLISGGASHESYGDHRIAMSMAILNLVAQKPSIINDTACVATSFPPFFQLLDRLSV